MHTLLNWVTENPKPCLMILLVLVAAGIVLGSLFEGPESPEERDIKARRSQ